jgi:hypothetical protein
VAVLHEDGLARGVEEGGVLGEVQLPAASVELDAVEAVVHDRVHVALIARVIVAVVAADAVVAVPPRREVQRVRVRRHRDEVGEALLVDNGPAIRIVEGVLVGAVAAARLPVVVQADVNVAEVAQGRGHAVDGAAAVDHARHLAQDQPLVDVALQQRGRARWEERERAPVSKAVRRQLLSALKPATHKRMHKRILTPYRFQERQPLQKRWLLRSRTRAYARGRETQGVAPLPHSHRRSASLAIVNGAHARGECDCESRCFGRHFREPVERKT